ncbi:hypothetical protein B0H10DRAFT_1746999, partial [Mycena sp. CBHHK59/15]
RRTDAGKYSLLRVIVSFPAETKMSRGGTLKNMALYCDEHPIASLNIGYLATRTKNMAPKNFLSTV